jgi:hypothetical protein
MTLQKSSTVEFVDAPSWFPTDELEGKISAIRLSPQRDLSTSFSDLSAEVCDRFFLKSCRIEKLPSLFLEKRTRVTVDARRHFLFLGFCPVFPSLSARIAAQYRFPPNLFHCTATFSLFGQYALQFRVDRSPPSLSYFYTFERSQKSDRAYTISTIGIGGYRIRNLLSSVQFQSISPASNRHPPVKYLKLGLSFSGVLNSLEYQFNPIILGGQLDRPSRWFNFGLKTTVNGKFSLPRHFSGIFSLGGVIARDPVPDPEKFYITSPLVWGIDCLSSKKLKGGIHPAGTDFFGVMTIRKEYPIQNFMTVSPFVNGGVAILSRFPRHCVEPPAPSYLISVGGLAFLKWKRNEINFGVSLALLRSIKDNPLKIEMVIDQPSLL